MNTQLPDRLNIFLAISQGAIDEHFNKNDPAPIYKRQLSQQFEQYINLAIARSRRRTVIEYIVTCKTEADNKFTEPFIYAIKRHYGAITIAKQAEFERFKRRNYMLLFIALTIIMLSHVVIPLFLKDEGNVQRALLSGLDIFSWVMMWQPIEKLLFHWNAYLKEINTFKKLSEARVVNSETFELSEIEAKPEKMYAVA